MSDLSINPAAHGPINPVRTVASLSHSSSSGIRRFDPVEVSSPNAGEDRVELSDMARLLNKMRDMPEVRHDRIADVRDAIGRGEYDSPARLNAALDKMLNDIAEEDTLGL